MNPGEIRLGPGVPRLAALGVRDFEDFFAGVGSGALARGTLARSAPGFELVRCPLPGTPDETDEPLRGGAPQGAGTGWLWLSRWTDASLAQCWRARFTHPRSTSLAERSWNLVCHLRAHGVATPEPLAVGRGEGAVFARRSFFVVRELAGMRPLSAWARESLEPRAAVRLARALGLALDRCFQAGVVLPELTAETIWAGIPRSLEAPAETCAVRGEAQRLRWGKLPEIALSEFAGGRILERVPVPERRVALERLAADLAHEGRLGLRVALTALRGVERGARRTTVHGCAARECAATHGVQRGSCAGGASSPT